MTYLKEIGIYGGTDCLYLLTRCYQIRNHNRKASRRASCSYAVFAVFKHQTFFRFTADLISRRKENVRRRLAMAYFSSAYDLQEILTDTAYGQIGSDLLHRTAACHGKADIVLPEIL